MFSSPAPAAISPALAQFPIRVWSAAAMVAVLCALAMLYGSGYAMQSSEQVSARTISCASIDIPSARECAPELWVMGGIVATADAPEIPSPAEPEEEPTPTPDRSPRDFPPSLRVAGSAQQTPLPIHHLYSGRAPPGNA